MKMGWEGKMRGIASLLMMVMLIAGCATRITQPSASAEDLATVTSFILEQNEARIHFYLGNAHFQGNTAQMNEAAELYINNVKAGMVGSKEEYTAIDLPPGTYTFESLLSHKNVNNIQ